jgi:hypothetical protein
MAWPLPVSGCKKSVVISLDDMVTTFISSISTALIAVMYRKVVNQCWQTQFKAQDQVSKLQQVGDCKPQGPVSKGLHLIAKQGIHSFPGHHLQQEIKETPS